MTAAVANQLKRRNTAHVVAWISILVVALCGLVLLRQGGQRLITRYNERNALLSAWDVYARGDSAGAAGALTRLIADKPYLRAQAIELLGPHATAMPAVYELLFPQTASDSVAESDTEAVFGHILGGRNAAAIAQIDRLSNRNVARPDLLLWRARQALISGEFDEARAAFDQYWRLAPRGTRQRSLDRIMAPDKKRNAEECINALLAAGLWTEAFAFTRENQGSGKSPMTTLCEGIEADFGGNQNAAKSKYTAVLEQRPTNRIAAMRLMKLSGG